MSSILCFTDIHFGKQQHSRVYNESALQTVKEYIRHCKENDIKYGAFLGDWHENRISIDVSTMNYSYQALILLNEYFKSVNGTLYFIIGNHDLYYRHTRDLHSIPFTNKLDHITPIESPQTINIDGTSVLFAPWLSKDEDFSVIASKTTASIMMGHHEFSSFKWNSNSFALTSGIPLTMVKHFKLVLSGHYHMRQHKKNIHYIGSCLQQNFGDCDNPRGFTVVDLKTCKLKFIENKKAPKFIQLKVSEALQNLDVLTGNYVKIIEDEALTTEEYNQATIALHQANPLRLIYESYRGEDEEVEELDSTDKMELVEIINELLLKSEREDKEELVKLASKYV